VPTRRRRSSGGRTEVELPVGSFARLDVERGRRTGAPEVLLAEGKSVEHLLKVVHALHRRHRGALISRPTETQRAALARAQSQGLPLTFLADGRLVRLDGSLGTRAPRGRVALVTAGTADVPVAEEARGVLDAVGVRTAIAYDVGVAGLHRLRRAVVRLERQRPNLYLAFAGREGALPTVLAGLVHAPVIGIPTSIGYGRGGNGEGALTAMLQSCAPIAVTNIDGAVPAALFALQLLHASARK
jgi:pyridinium-3,5-biscarboxylic acid mononucleotide synthase